MVLRDNRFDNIKGIMIFLVVFCHSLEMLSSLVTTNMVVKTIYCIIYSFHMPVFIFISGYFSKPRSDETIEKVARKAIAGCLIPYVFFNLLYDIPYKSIAIILDTLNPSWTLWFLLSLFFWKILVVPFSKVRISFFISVVFALYVGTLCQVGPFLSISRTICFFPFFLAGYLVSPDIIEKIRKYKIGGVLLFLVSIIVTVCLVKNGISHTTFFMYDSYQNVGQTVWQGIIYRLIVILLGFVGIIFFTSIIPQKKMFISKWGMYSISIYVFHSIIIRTMNSHGFLIENLLQTFLFAIIFATLICLLFGNEKVYHIYKKFFDKVDKVLLIDDTNYLLLFNLLYYLNLLERSIYEKSNNIWYF